MDKYLPLGTVVGLEDTTHRFMIVGRQHENSSGEKFDYIAFLYPYGYIDNQKIFVFNADKIKTVYYVGYQDIIELEYRKRFEAEEGN